MYVILSNLERGDHLMEPSHYIPVCVVAEISHYIKILFYQSNQFFKPKSYNVAMYRLKLTTIIN